MDSAPVVDPLADDRALAPGPLPAYYKWIGAAGISLLILIVETRIGVRQRRRPSSAGTE
jgi:hypothetical protein